MKSVIAIEETIAHEFEIVAGTAKKAMELA